MVNHIKPKHRKWTPEITETIDRDKYDKTVIGPYEHGVLEGLGDVFRFVPFQCIHAQVEPPCAAFGRHLLAA